MFLEVQTEAIKTFEKEIFNYLSLNDEIGEHYETSDLTYAYRIKSSFSSCEVGQIFNPIRNVCERCVEGYYSLFLSDIACNSCPDNAKCPGGGLILLDDG